MCYDPADAASRVTRTKEVGSEPPTGRNHQGLSIREDKWPLAFVLTLSGDKLLLLCFFRSVLDPDETASWML